MMDLTLEQRLMQVAYRWGIDDPQIVDDIVAVLGERVEPDYEAGVRMMVTWFTHFENTNAPKDPAHLYAMTVEVVDSAIGDRLLLSTEEG